MCISSAETCNLSTAFMLATGEAAIIRRYSMGLIKSKTTSIVELSIKPSLTTIIFLPLSKSKDIVPPSPINLFIFCIFSLLSCSNTLNN